MHPDVGFYEENWLYGPAYKAMWMFLAIIYPEFVVSCAVSQFVQARDLFRAWESYWRDEQEKEREKWLGISGAFLVVMGGYEITCPATCHGNATNCPMAGFGSTALVDERSSVQSAEHTTSAAPTINEGKTRAREEQRPNKIRRTLTPKGLKKLLEPKDGRSECFLSKLIKKGILSHTHFDPRQIEDKGKANYIAKLITTAQILWMVVQWVGRKGQGLPVTLLEIPYFGQLSESRSRFSCHMLHILTQSTRDSIHSRGLFLLVGQAA
jgi:hypothetical protein